MSQHKAKIEWKGGTPDFRLGKYTREHSWGFDGGLNVPASASPSVVPLPYCNPANIDPEALTVVVVGDRATIEPGIRALNLGPVRVVGVEEVVP